VTPKHQITAQEASDRRAAAAAVARGQREPLVKRSQPGLAAVKNERHIDTTVLGIEMGKDNMKGVLRAPKFANGKLRRAHSTN